MLEYREGLGSLGEAVGGLKAHLVSGITRQVWFETMP